MSDAIDVDDDLLSSLPTRPPGRRRQRARYHSGRSMTGVGSSTRSRALPGTSSATVSGPPIHWASSSTRWGRYLGTSASFEEPSGIIQASGRRIRRNGRGGPAVARPPPYRSSGTAPFDPEIGLMSSPGGSPLPIDELPRSTLHTTPHQDTPQVYPVSPR